MKSPLLEICICVFGNKALWHYLADLGRGVEFLPEIKIPVGFWLLALGLIRHILRLIRPTCLINPNWGLPPNL